MGRRRIDRWKTPPGWKAADGCTILGCGRPGIARGMCWNHYMRARRGDAVYVYLRSATSGGPGRKLVIARFGPEKPRASVLRMYRFAWEIAANVTMEPTTGCALWLGEYFPSGYGRLGNCRDPWSGYAHRAALYFNGVRLERSHSRHVRHLCDNPACVNVAHLAYGTAAENAADRSARWKREGKKWGTWLRPRRKTMVPSLVAYVREAYALGATKAELARDLGVHWNTVHFAIVRLPDCDRAA